MVKKAFILILLFINSSNFIFSENDIEIKIYSNKNTVNVNKAFQISIEISGKSSNVNIDESKINDPRIKLYQSGTMSNVSIINGVMTSAITITYICKISEKGDYEIGPFIINNKDQNIESDILKISVITDPQKTSEASSNIENGSSNDNEYYSLKLHTDKHKAYISEPIIFEVVFLYRAEKRGRNYRPLSFPNNVWVENIKLKENTERRIKKNNRNFIEYTIESKKVYFTKPGTYTIKPAIFEFYGFSPNSFFAEPYTLSTKPLTVTIKSLPPNPPNNFSDIIGQFKMNTKLEPRVLTVKDSATLIITLTGKGNFQNIEDIGFVADSTIEIYSSKSDMIINNKDIKTKKWEILLVPSKPGKFKLKSNDFVFFDPEQDKYISLRGENWTLNVKRPVNDTLYEESSFTGDIKETNIKNISDIRYINLKLGKISNPNIYNFWLKFIIVLYLALFSCIFLFLIIKYLAFSNLLNLTNHKMKSAYKHFSINTNLLKKDLNKLNAIKSIDKISYNIEQYLKWKFNIDSVKLTAKSIQDTLKNYIQTNILSKLKDVLVQMDMVRFGGQNITHDEISNLIETVSEYIKQIEQIEKDKIIKEKKI